jgi:hypothetical protein
MREGYLHADAAKIVLKDMSVSSFPMKGNFYVQKGKGEIRMPQASAAAPAVGRVPHHYAGSGQVTHRWVT